MARGEIRSLVVKSILVFVFSLIVIFITLYLRNVTQNNFLLAVLIAVLVFVFSLIFFFLVDKSEALDVDKGGLMRYSMYCPSCGWEWMSNTTDKDAPHKCPNCGEKSRLDIVGWRRIKVLKKKSDKDLRRFFKT